MADTIKEAAKIFSDGGLPLWVATFVLYIVQDGWLAKRRRAARRPGGRAPTEPRLLALLVSLGIVCRLAAAGTFSTDPDTFDERSVRRTSLALGVILSADLAANLFLGAGARRRLSAVGAAHHAIVAVAVLVADHFIRSACPWEAPDGRVDCAGRRIYRTRLLSAFLAAEVSSIPYHLISFVPRGSCVRTLLKLAFGVSFAFLRLCLMPVLVVATWLESRTLGIGLVFLAAIQFVWAAQAVTKKRLARSAKKYRG